MKRSDLVAKLIGYLIDQEQCSGKKININKNELCSYLLDCCIREGMLPPRTYLKELGMYDNGWDDE